MIKNRLLFLLLCIPALLSGQNIKGRILHADTKEPLAFVTVVEEGSQNGTYSDIDGYFTLSLKNHNGRLFISSLGFTATSILPDDRSTNTIYLKPQAIQIREVLILPGENPAEIIMRKVLANKDRNNPEKVLAFTYDSYNKLVFTGQSDSTKAGTAMGSNSLDSSQESMKRFFEDKHLFLLESATRRKHMPPGKDEETILATRVSGLKNPQFALLGTQLQSFSLYGDFVSILDLKYLSPISKEAIGKYLFILEDSTQIRNDIIYTISFRPRKNKNFTGMKGTLSISTDGWAIRNVIAQPADSNPSVSIRIQQQYSKIDGAWFPEQLNSFITFPQMKVNDIGVTGISKSYIRNVNVKPALRKRDFGPVVLSMEPKATAVPDSVWDMYREHELDAKEVQTYQYMDSVGKAENFEKKIKIFGMIGNGKIPLGIINIDMNRILRLNGYEGIRLGAGLHSNDFLSERFSIGGYYAYGFKDEAHKYGGDLLIHMYRKRNAWLRFNFEDDVSESGGHMPDPKPGNFLNANYYPYFISRMDRYTKKEVTLNGRLLGNLSTQLFVNLQEIKSYKDFGYLLPRTDQAMLIIRNFTQRQAGITARWAPGEKLAVAGEKEVSLGGKWPVFYFRYTHNVIDEIEKTSGFDRFDVLMEKTFKTTLYGDLTCRIAGGYLPESVPSNLYYNARGTNTINFDKNRFVGIAAPNTFETMRTNEFLHAQFIAIHLRHQFRDLLIQSKNFKPLISIVHNMLWGKTTQPELQLLNASVAEKGFFESGISIDRMLKSGFSNIGLAFFYRYGGYAFEKPADNFVAKISASVSF